MVDTLDWMLRPREIEQMPQVVDAEDSVEAIEEVIEEDSVEDVAASEEAVEGSVEETEEDLVGLEQTHLWCWARMTKTPRRDRLAGLLVRRWLYEIMYCYYFTYHEFIHGVDSMI